MEVKIQRGKLETFIYIMAAWLVPHGFLYVHIAGVQVRMWCQRRCSSQSIFSFVSLSFIWMIFFNLLKNYEGVQCLCASVPLYQDYCLQEMKGYLQRISKTSVSELLSPQYMQGLQSRLCSSSSSSTEAALPPPEPLEQTAGPSVCLSIPRSIPTVTPGTLWQDLEEVKASGIISSMTAKEIHLQEVSFCCSLVKSPK